MKTLKQKSGFTLIEMLVAMTIFMAFVGVLISSYTSIVRAQREANEYRVMYSEARQVFETITSELRDGMVDYGYYRGTSFDKESLILVSKDASRKTEILFDSGSNSVKVKRGVIPPNVKPCVNVPYNFEDEVSLNSADVKVTKFRIYVSPTADPYDLTTEDLNGLTNIEKAGSQYHPMVTIYAQFKRQFSDTKDPFVMDLETTVSSRIYNRIYQTDNSECDVIP